MACSLPLSDLSPGDARISAHDDRRVSLERVADHAGGHDEADSGRRGQHRDVLGARVQVGHLLRYVQRTVLGLKRRA